MANRNGDRDRLNGDGTTSALVTNGAFDRAVASAWFAFQPIVSLSRRRVFATELFPRSDEPLLHGPDELLVAAKALGRREELGRVLRRRAAALVERVPTQFVCLNIGMSDLYDDDLYDEVAPLSRVARRIILEVGEGPGLSDLADAEARFRALRRLGYLVAIDGLGMGGALSRCMQIEPDMAKLDGQTIRNIQHSPARQATLASLCRVLEQLGASVVAEGIETAGERDALAAAGCDLVQGPLFGRPAREFERPTLSSLTVRPLPEPGHVRHPVAADEDITKPISIQRSGADT